MTYIGIPTRPEVDASAPRAARLICAVADEDTTSIREALSGLDARGVRALAIHLARLVPDNIPMTTFSPAHQVDIAIEYAAAAWRTTPDALTGRSRRREDADARAVAMAALRLAGHTSVSIGEAFGRDHSTVLHAAIRVGENARLRRVAARIADKIGVRGHLGDDDEEEVA